MIDSGRAGEKAQIRAQPMRQEQCRRKGRIFEEMARERVLFMQGGREFMLGGQEEGSREGNVYAV